MNTLLKTLIICGFIVFFSCCTNKKEHKDASMPKSPVILDTDANNELDDQHAMAYLLLNGQHFDVRGITVNATSNGGDIENHYAEAKRVVKLCNLEGKVPLFKGANGQFDEIKNRTGENTFDGSEAVRFIIESARKEKLVVIAVGKLTNIALALQKDPSISDNIRLVWLGSNFPEAGEYNLNNDTSALKFVLNSDVPFDMVTVRYGKPSGTDAVRVTQEEVERKMPGKGPEIAEPVTGRHGGSYNNFGDYSVNLFKHIDYYGDPPSRALFDVAAVAIVKNPSWADSSRIPRPELVGNSWKEQPDNKSKMIVWENFDRDEIISDFYSTLDQ